MRFIDNWCYALTDELAAGGTELPVPGEAIPRLALADGDEYVLCIVSALDPLSGPALEVVRLVGLDVGYELQRGEQGTAAQDWPEGAVVHCGVTAALLAGLYAQASLVPELADHVSDLLERVAALAANLDVPVFISGAWNVGAPTNYEAIVSAGTVLDFTEQPGSVWANVELTNDRTYTTAEPCFVRLRVVVGDGLVAIITPLTEHSPPV